MTNQEAIEIISNTPFMSSMKKIYSADDRTPQDDPLYSPLYEALQMAIQALEDNECLKEKCRKLYNKLTETLKNTQREHECLIEELKSRTAELQSSYRKVHLIYAEYQKLKAELEQSVKLPCKIGDTIYCPWRNDWGDIERYTVEEFIYDENGLSFVCDTEDRERESVEEFGKTAFLTIEEAAIARNRVTEGKRRMHTMGA